MSEMSTMWIVELNFNVSYIVIQDDSTSISAAAAATTTKSRELTRSLLSLDLGYSVLNEELMRRSIGVDVDRLDVLPDDDGNDMALDIEGEEFFETLPQPQHLGRIWLNVSTQFNTFRPILDSSIKGLGEFLVG